MKKIKISIIIPTYNRAWCIKECIESVLNQDYNNWELFIIDDGSKDSTKQIVGEYLENKKVQYFYKENGGKASAINYALDKIEVGDLILIHDSDDKIMTGILKKAVEDYIITNGDYLVYLYKCKFPKYITGRYSKIFTEKKSLVGNFENELMGQTHIGDCKGFINSREIGKIRPENNCPNGLELIFLLRILKKGNIIYYNHFGFIIDGFRKPNIEKDNLTSFFSTFNRASSMIKGYDILVSENEEKVKKINSNILSNWRFEQFQWCIIDRNLKKGFTCWFNALRLGNLKNKFKILVFGSLFFIPKYFLSPLLKFYYKTK